MEVLRSALRHGIPSEDIHHAVINAVAVDEVGDDPVRWKEFHAPESAGPARMVVLVGLGLVAHMTIFDLRFNLAHRLLAWEQERRSRWQNVIELLVKR